MKKTIDILTKPIFIYLLFTIIGFLIAIPISIVLNDYSYLYGYLLSIVFYSFSILIHYLLLNEKPNKNPYIIMSFFRYFLLVLPVLITLILYVNNIYQINVLGILIGVIIYLLENFIFSYLIYRVTKNKKVISENKFDSKTKEGDIDAL